MKIDISLHNTALYKGCVVEEVGGRFNLKTPPAEAANIVGRNMAAILETISPADRDEVVLTGPMAVWVYLVVFHQVLHRFRRVVYVDGHGERLTVAAHG